MSSSVWTSVDQRTNPSNTGSGDSGGSKPPGRLSEHPSNSTAANSELWAEFSEVKAQSQNLDDRMKKLEVEVAKLQSAQSTSSS